MANQRKKTTEEDADSSVSRRTFLQSVIVASAAAGATAALPAQATAGPAGAAAAGHVAAGTAFRVLTEDQAGLMAAVLNRLIPADGHMPAAGDIGIVRYIDDALADAAHLRQPILDVLNEVHVSGVDVADASGLDAVLKRVEGMHKESFDTLLQATYTGYYSHPDVLHAIGWVPPGLEADSEETLDVSVLDDVIRRGPVFKHV